MLSSTWRSFKDQAEVSEGRLAIDHLATDGDVWQDGLHCMVIQNARALPGWIFPLL